MTPSIDAATDSDTGTGTATGRSAAVSCTRLAYSFGETTAVDGLDLSVDIQPDLSPHDGRPLG
ncbi:hypothetical protein AB0I50_52260, partial [Streptomyces prunicolor]